MRYVQWLNWRKAKPAYAPMPDNLHTKVTHQQSNNLRLAYQQKLEEQEVFNWTWNITGLNINIDLISTKI